MHSLTACIIMPPMVACAQSPPASLQINEEHHLTEKASKAVVNGLNALTKAIKDGAKGSEKGKEGEGGGGEREYDFEVEAHKK